MPTVKLDIFAVRSIIKYELMTAPKSMLASAIGKSRVDRDNALGALADRIGVRFAGYSITKEVGQRQDAAHLAVPPNRECES